MKTGEWKENVAHELIEYAANVAYLAVVFASFAWYRRLILASYDISYSNYWFALIEALILGKVIMIGSIFRLGRSLEEMPLFFASLYKTAIFGVFCAAFTVAEHAAVALWTGKGLAVGLEELVGKSGHEVLANTLMLVIALFPYFAFRELGRAFGRERLREIFFVRRTDLVTRAEGKP
jgi:hypothetical protein